MIGKYDFVNLITEHREQEERVDDLYDSNSKREEIPL